MPAGTALIRTCRLIEIHGSVVSGGGRVTGSALPDGTRGGGTVVTLVLGIAFDATRQTLTTAESSDGEDPGFDLAPAAPTLSTAPLATTIAFHDDADVSDWPLYGGRGHCQGEGRVYTPEGRIVASYSVHALVRLFEQSR